MMEWRMEPITVAIDKHGRVVLEQAYERDDPETVTLHPMQVELVCQCLREARDKAIEMQERGEVPES